MTFLIANWKFVLIVLLGLLLGLQTVRVAELKQDAADKRAMDAEAQRMAERAQREQEKRWGEVITKEMNDEQVRTAAAVADAAAFHDAAVGLRVARDDALGRVRALTAAAAGSKAKRADDAARMLAFVQGRIDARADLLAGVADERAGPGRLCERISDGLRAQQLN